MPSTSHMPLRLALQTATCTSLLTKTRYTHSKHAIMVVTPSYFLRVMSCAVAIYLILPAVAALTTFTSFRITMKCLVIFSLQLAALSHLLSSVLAVLRGNSLHEPKLLLYMAALVRTISCHAHAR